MFQVDEERKSERRGCETRFEHLIGIWPSYAHTIGIHGRQAGCRWKKVLCNQTLLNKINILNCTAQKSQRGTIVLVLS
jgi:hypothetical protein